MTRLPKRTQMMALAGVGLLALVLVAKFVFLRPPGPVASPPLVIHHHQATVAKTKSTLVDPEMPAPLRVALARHKVVVAALYAPGAPGDPKALAAARQGAGSVHAGFAALDINDEWIARAAATKLSSNADPSVLVVRRPGTVAFVFHGYADAAVVAQAAAQWQK